MARPGTDSTPPPPGAPPGLATFVRVFGAIGLESFGGPAGQIAVMHRELVERRRWVDEERYLHALNYCMLLPGPEAMQLCTYVGWLLRGWRGGLIAGLLFVLPGFLTVLALSATYAHYREVDAIAAAFFGLKAGVLAIVVHAAVRIGRRVLRGPVLLAIAAAAFVAVGLAGVPFPLVVIGAGAIGWLRRHRAPAVGDAGPAAAVRASATPLRDTLSVLVLWLAIWWLPVAALALVLGGGHLFVAQAVFFSKAAVITFGGAYAVLGYIAQQAVERFGWLAPTQMLDGLGLAETTPGPLILVVEFVGFVAAYQAPGALPPLVAGAIGAVVTTWVTFAPCFLWIFVGAPWIERLRQVRGLAAALSAITAAVVGVIASLAVWFAGHVLFAEQLAWRGPLGHVVALPRLASLDLPALAIAATAAGLLFGLGRSPLVTALACAGLGLGCAVVGIR